jgi:hypothetical protein
MSRLTAHIFTEERYVQAAHWCNGFTPEHMAKELESRRGSVGVHLGMPAGRSGAVDESACNRIKQFMDVVDFSHMNASHESISREWRQAKQLNTAERNQELKGRKRTNDKTT